MGNNLTLCTPEYIYTFYILPQDARGEPCHQPFGHITPQHRTIIRQSMVDGHESRVNWLFYRSSSVGQLPINWSTAVTTKKGKARQERTPKKKRQATRPSSTTVTMCVTMCACDVFTLNRSFYSTISVHPVSVLILYPTEITNSTDLWDRKNKTIAINQGKASEMLAYLVR